MKKMNFQNVSNRARWGGEGHGRLVQLLPELAKMQKLFCEISFIKYIPFFSYKKYSIEIHVIGLWTSEFLAL